MLLINRVRGGGKTSQLIRMSAANGYYMVVRDHTAAYRCVVMADQVGLRIPFPLTYYEYTNKMYDSTIPGVLIDDVEEFLLSISRVPVAAISVTVLD